MIGKVDLWECSEIMILFSFWKIPKSFLTNKNDIFKTQIPTESYQVYLKGEPIGLIKSDTELYDYINEKQQDLKEKYNASIILPDIISCIQNLNHFIPASLI